MTFIKKLFSILMILAVSLFVLCVSQSSSQQVNGKSAVLEYINSLAVGEVGYGWEGQYDGHITPTFAAIGVLYQFNELPEDRNSLIEFVNTHHPQRNPNNREAGYSGTEIRDLVYQQIQSLLWLGGDVSYFKYEVREWESQQGHRINFEKQGYPAFTQEMMEPVVRKLLGMPQAEEIISYLKDRRRNNGSFNSGPASEGGDGNIINTYWGIYAWILLNGHDELKEETIQWVHSNQLEDGGYTHQPDPIIGVNAEMIYTWAAIKTLNLLSSRPTNTQKIINYLLSLQNSDGGFGNRPGLPSTPMSTFYAVDALQTLNALEVLESVTLESGKAYNRDINDYSDYRLYTVQFQSAGSGSPLEAVMMADSLNTHLWGAKNANSDWIDAAQRIASERNVPVTFFHSNEDYGKQVKVEGMGSFNHVFDNFFPAKNKFTNSSWSLGNNHNLTWESFVNDYILLLDNDNGALLWQVNYNEPMTRLLLDHSINENKGYIAISTVHFDQNFLFWQPYLYQYRHQLAFIALQDFHGEESWWWGNDLVSYRNIFLAKEPTYEAMIEAVKTRRIVTVRHDELTKYKTRMLGGAEGVQEHILSRIDEWRWWDNKSHEPNHPWAAITVLKPYDKFEEALPEQGVNIRIRCWWSGPKETLTEPLVSLINLKINGKEVHPGYLERTNREGRKTDAYYLYSWPDVPSGEHFIEATFQRHSDNTIRTITRTFTQKK